MNNLSYNETEEVDFADTIPYFEYVVIAVVMSIICALTIVGNLLVLLSFILDRKLRTHNNYFLLSLAVSDIMIATFAMPLFTMYMLIGEWPLGPVLCDMWLAQDYMCSNASGLNLMVISLDRYLSVTSPLRYRARRSGKHVAVMISCVWVTSFLIWPPWIYSWQYIEGRRTVPVDECYVQFLETNTYLTVITATIAYYIPTSVMCILYFRIWRETVKRKHYIDAMESKNQSLSVCPQKEDKNIPQQNKSPYLVLFTFCYSRHRTLIKQDSTKTDKEMELLDQTPFSSQSTKSDPLPDSVNKCNENNEIDETAFDNTENSEVLKQTFNEHSSVHKNAPLRVSSIRKQDNKAARVLSAILLVFLITVTPYNVLVIIKSFDTSYTLVPDALWYFCYFLFYVNSTLNPVCYALANIHFRKTYWKILTCSWSKKSRNSSLFRNSSLYSSSVQSVQ